MGRFQLILVSKPSKCPVKTLFINLVFLPFCRHIQTFHIWCVKAVNVPSLKKKLLSISENEQTHTHKKKLSKKLE